MSNKHFAAVPNISIPRSRFKQPFNHATTMLHGDLVPIDCFEVIAGDTYHCKLNAMTWMSTPIAPIFGNIKMYFKAYFVPMRLVWQHWEEFFGANKTSAGYQTTTYTIPNRSVYRDGITSYSVSHYLGKPVVSYDVNKFNYGLASVLKERAYYLIWNEYYRAQQVQNPVLVSLADTGTIGSLNGSYLWFNAAPMKVNKEFDYFTAATLSPQYGPAVSLPLGTFAPLVADSSTHSLGGSLKFGQYGGTDSASDFYNLYINGGNVNDVLVGTTASTTGTSQTRTITSTNLIADLSSATAATINELRYAFAVQKYLERANFGNRYFEILSVHYGVTSPDSRLQIPERLGSTSMNISINTVLSTAGADTSPSTKLGQPGAVSCSTMGNRSLFTKAFVEPGYVFIMASTHHERSYSQGLLREDFKFNRFDFYSPEFANLGDQAVYNKELFVQGAAADEQVFGYQEHWAEYRYRPDRVSGLLDPAVTNGLDFWTLGEKFSALPTLSGSFLEENRDLLARALVTGTNGPDYICDFYFDYTATREMPLITIPGLIDHFGTM